MSNIVLTGRQVLSLARITEESDDVFLIQLPNNVVDVTHTNERGEATSQYMDPKGYFTDDIERAYAGFPFTNGTLRAGGPQ